MSRRGFSLVETLVAVLMLGVLSSMLVAAWPSLLQLNRSTIRDVDVTTAVKMYFENVRVSWQDPAVFDAGTLPASPTPAGYTCTASVSNPDAGVYSPPIRKRVALTCIGAAGSSAPSRNYILELGRP